MEELRNWIEQTHGGECVKVIQASKFALESSRAAEALLACAPSSIYAMIRLRDATIRAAAADKVLLLLPLTPSLGHDVSECVFVVFGVISQKIKW